MKSRRHKTNQILGTLSAPRAEQLLTALANLSGDWQILTHLENLPGFESTRKVKREGVESSAIERESYSRMTDGVERLRNRYREAFGEHPAIALLVLRDLVRKAWTAADVRSAEWYLFRFRHLHWETVRRIHHVRDSARTETEIPTIPATVSEGVRTLAQSDAPPLTQLEAAAFHLQKNLYRALRCPNPECPAPFFFRRKKGQKFCSTACALPAQRASKLRWWKENRTNRRKK